MILKETPLDNKHFFVEQEYSMHSAREGKDWKRRFHVFIDLYSQL